MKLLYILVPIFLVGIVSGYVLPATTFGGNVTMNNHNIVGLAEPSLDTDAATKAYADSIIGGNYLPLSGGTLTGWINLGSFPLQSVGTPSNDSDASTKKYVDDAVSPLASTSDLWDKVNKSGDTMSGPLAMGTQKITGVGNGTAAQDAVTYSQLDAKTVITVGPYSWCTVVTDGNSDQTEINSALIAYKDIVLVNAGYFNCDGNIIIPSGARYSITGRSYLGKKPEVRFDAGHGVTESDGVVKQFELDDIDFNANGTSSSLVFFDDGVSDTSIHHCIFRDITQSTESTNYGIALVGTIDDPNTNVDIYSNEFRDILGFPLYLIGGWGEHNYVSSEGISVRDNRVIHGMPYNFAPFPAIYADYANIHNNYVLGYGLKNTTYDYSSGEGIGGGDYTTISGNTIIGCGRSGITTGYYSNVFGNTVKYCGGCGIDFFYSSYSNFHGNNIYDNGQFSDADSMDRSGIDVADHSSNCLVTGNMVTNRAASMSTTTTGTCSSGAAYITVANLPLFAEAEGLTIKVNNADTYRISYIDQVNNRIYLTTVLSNTYTAGMTVVGVARQYVGIHIGDNGQSLGYHLIADNYVIDNVYSQVGTTVGGTVLPNTYVDGSGFFVHTADPGYVPTGAPYFMLSGGKFYLCHYQYGIGQKKVEVT